MAAGTAGAVIAAAVIGAGASAHAAGKQREAAQDDEKRRRAEAEAAKAEADRIARMTKPEEQSASGEIQFGAEGTQGNIGGSSQEFLVPKSSSLGQSSGGRSGLGFRV